MNEATMKNPPTSASESTQPPEPREYQQAGRGSAWKFALLADLASSKAPRIFTAAELLEFAQKYRPGTTPNTVRLLAEMLVSVGALRPVTARLFLNRRALPPAEIIELAAHVRAESVISLHSVLGECGFLNNPAAIVTAVRATSTTKRPNLGEFHTSAGETFRFYGLAERFFPQTEKERFELLQPGRMCDMFRPEAALLQWLHLAGMERSSLTPPPVDVDMDTLDHRLLGSLAIRWGLERNLATWLAKAESLNFGEEPEPVVKAALPTATQGGGLEEAGAVKSGLPVSTTTDEQAAAARARVLARRPKPAP